MVYASSPNDVGNEKSESFHPSAPPLVRGLITKDQTAQEVCVYMHVCRYLVYISSTSEDCGRDDGCTGAL